MIRSVLIAAVTLAIAVPVTFLVSRSTTADNRGIILNVDQEGPEHVRKFRSLMRQSKMITPTDTIGGGLYVFLDKTDLMKAFNEHNSNTGKRDSIVGFIIHYGFYGDTLKPAQGKLIPYIRPVIFDEKGKRVLYNEDAYEYLPNGCPSRCDLGVPESVHGVE